MKGDKMLIDEIIKDKKNIEIQLRNAFLSQTNSNIYYTNSGNRILELSKSGLKNLFQADDIILRG